MTSTALYYYRKIQRRKKTLMNDERKTLVYSTLTNQSEHKAKVDYHTNAHMHTHG